MLAAAALACCWFCLSPILPLSYFLENREAPYTIARPEGGLLGGKQMTTRLVIANWKMNGDLALIDATGEAYPQVSKVDVIVVPPSLYVAALLAAANDRFQVGLQDIGRHDGGAHTGELAASMAAELGVAAVIVGHSERRADNSEDDAIVAAKAQRVLEAGLMPVICVGESIEERQAGQAEARVRAQVEAQAENLRSRLPVAIAYEPIWAIGTGVSASVVDAVAMHRAIRSALEQIAPDHSDEMRILYGGSVNAENAAELFAHVEIEGVLVGGASLDTDQFAAIIRAAGAAQG